MDAKPYTAGDVGKNIHFPWTRSVCVVVAVDETAETLTFATIGDPGDNATETFADLVAIDAVVLR